MSDKKEQVQESLIPQPDVEEDFNIKLGGQPAQKEALKTKTTNRLKAIIGMNLFCLLSTVVSIIFKLINRNGVTPTEFMLWRNFWNGVFICGVIVPLKVNPWKDTNGQLPWIAARCLIGQCCFIQFTYSITLIPLSLHMILLQTSPFWVSILAFLFNKERILRFELVAMVLCFGGVMMIANSKAQKEQGAAALEGSTSTELLGVGVAFSTAWFFACCNVLNRKLSEVHFSVIMLYHSALGTCMALVYIAATWLMTGEGLVIHDMSSYGYLFLCCCLDFFCLNAQNIAFQSDSSGFVSIIGYIVVFYGFLADEFIFMSPITGFDLAGAICIFVVTLGVTVYKLRQQTKKRHESHERETDIK